MDRPYILGVAGASGSGKTTLAKELQKALRYNDISCTVFSLDNYYRDQTDLAREERVRTNYDDPGAVDLSLAREHLLVLSAGNTIERPNYDFKEHNRAKNTTTVEPTLVIVLEGLFALQKQLCDCYDFSIFLSTDFEICLKRRRKRDVHERGRSPESVERQLQTTVIPGYWAFVYPSRKNAAYSFEWDGAMSDKVDELTAKIVKELVTG